jgi:chemotaxis protein histidine kinase CheA
MASFSIDDVRDSFTADITALLGQIGQSAQGLLALREALPAMPRNANGRPLFEAMAAAGHTVAGTAGLVGADSLARSGKLIEQVTRQGQIALRRAQAQLVYAGQLAELCNAAAQAMGSMLEAELQHDPQTAQRLATELEAYFAQVDPITEVRTDEVALVGMPSPQEQQAVGREEEPVFSFDREAEPSSEPTVATVVPASLLASLAPAETADAAQPEAVVDTQAAPPPAAPTVTDATDGAGQVDPELAAVFQEEAREAADALKVHLQALAGNLQDKTAASVAERVYHTLKGASATVGFSGISRVAAHLQDLLGSIAEGAQLLTAELLTRIVADTNRMMQLVGLPELTIGTGGSAAVPASLDEFSFGDEVSESQMPEPPVGAESTAKPVGDEFSFGEEAAVPQTMEGMDAELMAIFQQEAREAILALQGHLRTLVEHPEDLLVAEQIERLFHTLRGSSATVGLTEVSQLAVALQGRMQQALDGTTAITPAFLEQLVAQTNGLLRKTGLPEIALRAEALSEPAAEESGAEQFFLIEAREAMAEGRRLMESLPNASAERTVETKAQLGRLFHRLKGSALVMGNTAASEEAAALQAVSEDERLTDVAALTAGLARLAKLLEVADGNPSTSTGASAPASVMEPVQVNAEPELWDAFLLECTEILSGCERRVLTLEEVAQPLEVLQALFRLYHTLKGALNAVGLAPTGRIVHRVEDFLETLQDAPMLPSMQEVANLLLEAQAEIRRHLRQAPTGQIEVSVGRWDARIARVMAGVRGGSVEGASQASSVAESEGPPSSAMSSRAIEVESAERRFIRVSTERLDSLMNLAGELVVSRSRLGSRVGALRSLQLDLSRGRKRLVERVEEFREQHEFSNLDGRRKTSRSSAAPLGTSATASTGSAKTMVVNATSATRKERGGEWSEFTDLELDRYDDINVLSRSLAEISDDFNEIFSLLFREMASFTDDSEVFGRIVSGIQSEVTRARMVPLDTLFTRLRLPVRDAALRDNRQVRVVTRGEDVNLDKTIADALFPPMLHLVRNAVAHGIETEVGRQAAGKEKLGTITLEARQESGQIVLEVSDDGRGLDLVALHGRGVAMGLIRPETPVSHPAVKDLVFAAGVSTASSVGAVSGRGVGGDVVRRSIERLNGEIRVETSARGTTFTITLPLTLAIARALLVRQAGRVYAVPLFFAEHILELDPKQIVESFGIRRMKIDDAFLPLRSLDELLGAAPTGLSSGQARC